MGDSMNIDFDTWAELARTDKDEFERRRRAVIEGVIIAADPDSQPRLRALQWRIDMERQRARTPLAACIRISAMMWESIYELRAALNDPKSVRGRANKSWPPAQVIEFKRRNLTTEIRTV
jgi:hypothetical protein